MNRFLPISCLLLLNTTQFTFAAPPASTNPTLVATFHFTPADEAILIKMTWNGKPADLIFDTGCATSGLDSTTFKLLTPTNAEVTEETPDGNRVSELYNPPDLSVGLLHLKDAGPVIRFDLSAIRAELDRPVIGILGTNVWHKLVAQIDFDNGELRFFEPDDLPHPEWGNAIRLESSQGTQKLTTGEAAYVRLTIGPFEDLFQIDTGDNGGGDLPIYGFDSIVHATTRPTASTPGLTVNGSSTTRDLRTPEFVLGENRYRNLIFGENANWYGRLGLQFLSRHLVTIDFPHARLYLKPGKAFNRYDVSASIASGVDFRRQQHQTTVVIIPKSPADLAGLRDGDVLLKVNGKDAASYELFDLRELLRSKEGTEIDVVFLRNGVTHSASFKLRKDL